MAAKKRAAKKAARKTAPAKKAAAPAKKTAAKTAKKSAIGRGARAGTLTNRQKAAAARTRAAQRADDKLHRNASGSSSTGSKIRSVGAAKAFLQANPKSRSKAAMMARDMLKSSDRLAAAPRLDRRGH